MYLSLYISYTVSSPFMIADLFYFLGGIPSPEHYIHKWKVLTPLHKLWKAVGTQQSEYGRPCQPERDLGAASSRYAWAQSRCLEQYLCSLWGLPIGVMRRNITLLTTCHLLLPVGGFHSGFNYSSPWWQSAFPLLTNHPLVQRGSYSLQASQDMSNQIIFPYFA